MPISIDKKNPKEDIWKFFVSWLRKLVSEDPQSAFRLIDDPSNSGTVWDVKEFSNILAEFSGEPEESYTYSDIVIGPKELADCYADSHIKETSSGTYLAILYIPLLSKGSHILGLDFSFRKNETGLYRVSLNCDDPFVT